MAATMTQRQLDLLVEIKGARTAQEDLPWSVDMDEWIARQAILYPSGDSIEDILEDLIAQMVWCETLG